MKQDEVEDLCTLADIFVPLGKAAPCRLCLHGQVLKKAHESPVLDIGRLRFDHPFNFFQVVEDLLRLLHVVFVAGLEDSALSLLVVEESQLDLDIHWILKLFDALLHGAKVAREVVLGLLLDEGEDDGQLVEEVVHRVQNGVHRQVCIR